LHEIDGLIPEKHALVDRRRLYRIAQEGLHRTTARQK
jgi:hypothetical protein